MHSGVKPHPQAGQEWFERLPLERQVEMAREHARRVELPPQLDRRERRRRRVEALQTGAVFAVAGWICSRWELAPALVCALLGTLFGWVCSRLDLKRLSTGALAVALFLGAQYLLHGWIFLVFFACLPVGAICAWIGWGREERGLS